MRHKFPNVSDYWKMKPKEQRASTTFYFDVFPNKVTRSAHYYEWFGLFGLTAKESLIEYGIAARCIDIEKLEFECYAPDPDEDDCSIYFITTEDYIEERLRKHRNLSTFLIQNNLSLKQFRLMEITEMIYVTSLHFDLIELLGLDIEETFIRTELSLDDNEKEEKKIVIEENVSQKQIRDLSNLDFHEALRCIIDNEGDEIIKEVRLVNILSDYKAFDSIPASKFILKSIITEGYSKRFYDIGCWNSKCEALIINFSLITGFQDVYVYYIFQCIAYGLGWISNIREINFEWSKQCDNNKKSIIKLSTKVQKEQFLLSKIVILNDIKQETGLDVSNYSFEVENSKRIIFNCEIKGKVKESCAGFYIKIVVYDDKNKIRFNNDLGFYCRNDSYFRGFNVITKTIDLPMAYSKISQIAIFV